jgi:hypothetical protein
MKKNYFYEVVWWQNATLQVKIFLKKIREYVVVHMRAAELAYKRRVQTKNLLRPTPRFLLEG